MISQVGATGPLLEREAELDALDAILAGAADGDGGTALISGLAGVGKSSLLAAAADRARGAGLRVLACRCQPLEREFSFGTVIELFGPAWAEMAHEDGAAQLTSRLFEQRGPDGAGPTPIFTLLHGLYWLTADLAASTPLLLVIDDIHWADAPSLRFLNYLAARLEGIPAVAMAAVRTGEAAGESSDLIAELAGIPSTENLLLGPLSPSGAERVVRDTYPTATSEFCAACGDVSGGNPFLLGELLEDLRAEGVVPDASAARTVATLAPDGIRRATLIRLGRLGSEVVEVAKCIALLQDDAELRHVAALAGVEAEVAVDAAETLTAAGILGPSDELEFAHPLLASAVRAEIPPRIREQLHRRAARALADEGAPSERIAAHLLAASKESEPWAVDLLRQAANDAVSRGSPEAAVRYLHRALAEPAGEIAYDLELDLGRVLTLAGSAEAVPALRRAADLAAAPIERARAWHGLARALYLEGQLDDAAEAFRTAAGHASGHDRELELQCEADFISVGLLSESHIPGVLGRMPEAVSRVGDSPLSAAERAILGSAGLVMITMGQPHHQAIALAERALDHGRLIAEEGADGTTVYSVTGVLSVCGALGETIRVCDETIERARRDGSIMGFATASYCRAHPLLWSGRPTEAAADTRTAIDSGWEQYLPVAYAFLIDALLVLDQVTDARLAADELDTERWGTEPIFAPYLQARARLLLAEGKPTAALSDAQRVPELFPLPNPGCHCEWRSLSAHILTALGERERAIALAAEELELVVPFGAPRSLAVAWRALGVAKGDDDGIEDLREAVALVEGTDLRLECASDLIELGALLRRRNQRTEAREILRRGIDLAQRCGLVALERRAGEELKLAGGKPRSRYVSGVESLTPGELRVARMAAEGMTNREIAQALFVTAKAVQWHLGNTYRKLEIGGRGELAAALGQASESA